jgi:hypothetical protein
MVNAQSAGGYGILEEMNVAQCLVDAVNAKGKNASWITQDILISSEQGRRPYNGRG